MHEHTNVVLLHSLQHTLTIELGRDIFIKKKIKVPNELTIHLTSLAAVVNPHDELNLMVNISSQ